MEDKPRPNITSSHRGERGQRVGGNWQSGDPAETQRSTVRTRLHMTLADTRG